MTIQEKKRVHEHGDKNICQHSKLDSQSGKIHPSTNRADQRHEKNQTYDNKKNDEAL